LRVDFETREPVTGEVEASLRDAIEAEVKRADVVLVSDYDKGVCTPTVLAAIIDAAKKRGQRVLTYGLGSADVRATGIAMGRTGIWLSVATPWGDGETTTQVVGAFNVDNLLGTLAVLLATDVPLADALEALSKLTPPPGRMQRLGGDGKPLVVVDYAHTPDALEKALTALRPSVGDGGELVCVFGFVQPCAWMCGCVLMRTRPRMMKRAVAINHAHGRRMTDRLSRSQNPPARPCSRVRPRPNRRPGLTR